MKRVYMLMVILSISACIPSGLAMTLLVIPRQESGSPAAPRS
jgi:hypothetical protein